MSLFGNAFVHLALSPPIISFRKSVDAAVRNVAPLSLPPQIPLRFALPSASFFRPEAGLEGQSKVA